LDCSSINLGLRSEDVDTISLARTYRLRSKLAPLVTGVLPIGGPGRAGRFGGNPWTPGGGENDDVNVPGEALPGGRP
jgi:hypothetical protein